MQTLKTLITVIMLLSFMLAPAMAGESSGDSAKMQDIRKLMKMMQVDKMPDMLAAQIKPMFEKKLKGKSGAEEMVEIFDEEFRAFYKEMLDMMIPLYAKYYTHDDIRELIVFYESPVGVKSIELMPRLMQDIMADMTTSAEKFAQRISERIKEKGLKK